MMEGMFGSGSNGAGNMGAIQELLKRKMLEEMFGLKVNERPAWQAAQPAGSDKAGSWGIIGVRLYAASITSPAPRLILETNGPLTIAPEDVKDVAAFLQSNLKACEAAWKDAVEKAKTMEGAEIFAAALGVESPKEK